METSMVLNDKRIVLSFMLLLLMSAAFFLSQVSVNPRLVVIDMKRAVNEPALMLSRSQLPPEAQTQLLQAFSKALPEVLVQYGTSHHLTVIASSVVVSGSADITDVVIQETFKRIKQHG